MFIIVQMTDDYLSGEVVGESATYPEKGKHLIGVPKVLECISNFDPVQYAISLHNQAVREVNADPSEYIEVFI